MSVLFSKFNEIFIFNPSFTAEGRLFAPLAVVRPPFPKKKLFVSSTPVNPEGTVILPDEWGSITNEGIILNQEFDFEPN